MNCQRVISFIDGFNLYHAICILRRPELVWTDLRALSKVFLKRYSEELREVYYFSAYAEHVSEPKQKCQKAYIKALGLRAVQPILGHFKKKNRKCPECDHRWTGHEEKETDVNIALYLPWVSQIFLLIRLCSMKASRKILSKYYFLQPTICQAPWSTAESREKFGKLKQVVLKH